jgi:hypothetical protein
MGLQQPRQNVLGRAGLRGDHDADGAARVVVGARCEGAGQHEDRKSNKAGLPPTETKIATRPIPHSVAPWLLDAAKTSDAASAAKDANRIRGARKLFWDDIHDGHGTQTTGRRQSDLLSYVESFWPFGTRAGPSETYG